MDNIQIPKHYADMFKDNVYHKVQQTQSVFSSGVRNESHGSGAESVFYDSYEKSKTKKRTERAQKTYIAEVDRDRRAVRADWHDWGTIIDKIDIAKTIHMPESALVQAATYAFNRTKDEVIYEAALGDSYAGQKGLDVVALPNSQKVVAFDGTTTGDIANLNIATLAKIKRKFWDNNIGTGSDMYPGGMLNIALRGAQIEQMLNDSTITSADYASVKALAQGDIDTFMGFKFHIYNGLSQNDAQIAYNNATGNIESGGTNTGSTVYDRAAVWFTDGLLLSSGQSMGIDIGPRRDLSNVTQVYADMHLGAVRMEEEKVIELFVKA